MIHYRMYMCSMHWRLTGMYSGWGGGGVESRLPLAIGYKARSTCTKRIIHLSLAVWCSDGPPLSPSLIPRTPTATVVQSVRYKCTPPAWVQNLGAREESNVVHHSLALHNP